MDKILKVAVILSAVDRMSSAVKGATEKSTKYLEGMKKAQGDMLNGAGLIAGGAAVGATLMPMIKAYAELEDSATRLKAAMMGPGGTVAKEFETVNNLALELGNALPGTTSDFQNMFEVLLNSGIEAKSILDGVGKSTAYLAVALKMPYDEAAKFAAKMKEATGVADSQMMQLLDTIARTKNLGVDVNEMQYAFGRSAGALKLVGLQGLEASKQVGALYAILTKTNSGETVGTGMTAIFSGMLDPAKMASMNAEAKKLGIHFEFFKNGKFVGIENMMQQLDKLSKFDATKRAPIVDALTGGGADSNMIQTLISKGLSGYRDVQRKMEQQASLQDKVNAMLNTLTNIWEAIDGTITNIKAAIGSSIGPELAYLGKLFRDVITPAVQAFVSENPKLMKFIGIMTALVSAGMLVVGAFMLIRGAVMAVTLTMMANPIIAIVTGIAMAATLIYVYWDDIVAFFKRIGKMVVDSLMAVGNWLKTNWKTALFALINPFPLIFKGIIALIKNFMPELYEAGKNIIDSIVNGITNKAEALYSKVKELTQKVRDFFPFSPAKRGPLMDIHKIKFAETLALAIKPQPVIKAVGAVAGAMANGPKINSRGGSGGGSITFAPVINLSGSATQSDGKMITDTLKQEFKKLMDDYNRGKARVSYA